VSNSTPTVPLLPPIVGEEAEEGAVRVRRQAAGSTDEERHAVAPSVDASLDDEREARGEACSLAGAVVPQADRPFVGYTAGAIFDHRCDIDSVAVVGGVLVGAPEFVSVARLGEVVAERHGIGFVR
jgi:hypothetical protein